MKKLLLAVCLLLSIQASSQQIKVLENTKIPDSDSVSVFYEFYIPIPAHLATIPNRQTVLQSFRPLFPSLDRVDGDNVVFRITTRFALSANMPYVKSYLQTQYAAFQTELNALQVPAVDYLNGATFDGNEWH